MTASLTKMLKFLAAQESLTNRWKVMLLLMGLTFHNPNARAAWFLLYSSLMHTWEMTTKFKKPINSQNVIFYRDNPSTRSAHGSDSDIVKMNSIPFRDRDNFE